jgi:hypothetical protein
MPKRAWSGLVLAFRLLSSQRRVLSKEAFRYSLGEG